MMHSDSRYVRKPRPNLHRHEYWQIFSIFAIIIIAEYATPSAYVFGYLYTGAILLANYRLSSRAVMTVTVTASGLTILNLFIPSLEIHSLPTLANRIIAVIALQVAGWLSIRNRIYKEKIAHQQAQLEARDQLARNREDFVWTLTHDLKTPILGAIETLKSLETGHFGSISPTQKKIVATIVRSHKSTVQLLETILDIYRNDAEGLQLRLETVNLIQLLEDTIASMVDLAQSRNIKLRLERDSQNYSGFWVKGDRLQLQRVFSNLLSNAINHSPRGSTVELSFQSKENQGQILISDGGMGIPEGDLPHIFERFYQGQSDRQAKGSGLGLYLSRQIVAAHNGKIWAENRSPQGAVFACSFPVLPLIVDETN